MNAQMTARLGVYKVYCVAFFADRVPSPAAVTTEIHGMDSQAFLRWNLDFYDKCIEVRDPIVELVREMRGDYDPLADHDDDDAIDPLHLPENLAIRDAFEDVWKQMYDAYIGTIPLYGEMMRKADEEREREAAERALMVTVEGRPYRALKRIDVLWSGWASGQYIWVVDHDGEKRFVATNHGQPGLIDKAFVLERIEAYGAAIAESEAALAMMDA